MEAIALSQDILSRSLKRRHLVFTFLLMATLLLVAMNVSIGSISYPLREVLATLASPGVNNDLSFIIWKIRLPRALAAAMGGAFLAASGLLLQVYFRNPIVGPFILGISSGATVMVSLVMLTSTGLQLAFATPFLTTLAGCVGAYAVMMLVVAIANKVKGGATLLVIGIMMGYLCGAVTAILTALAEKEKIKGFILW